LLDAARQACRASDKTLVMVVDLVFRRAPECEHRGFVQSGKYCSKSAPLIEKG